MRKWIEENINYDGVIDHKKLKATFDLKENNAN